MTIKNYLFLLLLLTALYFFYGSIISITLLILILFQKDSIQFINALGNFNTDRLKELYIVRRKTIHKILVGIYSGIFFLNVILLILGKHQGNNEDNEKYYLPFSTVEVKALTFSIASDDDGPAEVIVNVNGWNTQAREVIETSFNYDLFCNTSPVYVRYGFYNLDLIPDLIIDTNDNDYFVSGISGNIYKQEFILDRIKK